MLLVGDAAGYVDALTGEGIAMGLRTARAAVACMAADRPQDYDRAWRGITREYRVLTRALVEASRMSLIRRHLVAAAAANPVGVRRRHPRPGPLTPPPCEDQLA